MKLIVFAVILSCCLVHVYSDCGASEVETVQNQYRASFGSNQARLRQFANACLDRSAPFHNKIVNVHALMVRSLAV